MTNLKTREGSILAIVVDEINRSLVFNVRGAAPDGGSMSATLDLNAVHQSNLDYAALHGFKQRIGDMAAQTKNPKTGESASAADKFAAILRGVDHFMSGSPDWNLRVAASGPRIDSETLFLARAIAQLKSKDLDAMVDWVKSKPAADRAALALKPEIKFLIDGYRAAGAADIDTDEMLSELE